MSLRGGAASAVGTQNGTVITASSSSKTRTTAKLADAMAQVTLTDVLAHGDAQSKLTALGLVVWFVLLVAWSIAVPFYHDSEVHLMPDSMFAAALGNAGAPAAAAFDAFNSAPLDTLQNGTAAVLDEASARLGAAGTGVGTTWTLFCGVCVFMMQSGFCFLEAGGVRSGSVINIILKNLCDCGIGAYMWWLVGFSIAYGELGNIVIGGQKEYFGLSPDYTDDSDPSASFYLSFVYMTTAATIVSGAVAERIECTAYIVFVFLLSGFGYPLGVRWLWSSYGWASPWSPDKVLANGCLDFAGSTVIHLYGGVCANVFAYLLGPRKLPGGHSVFDPVGQRLTQPHNKLEMAVGTLLLWFSWFAFNGGSVAGLAGDQHRAGANAIVATLLASATACLTGALLFRYTEGCFEITGTCNCALAGLVAITAGCAYVSPVYAPIIGFVAVFVYVGFVKFRVWMRIDDVVDAGAVHFANGAWGTIAAGLFADPTRIKLATGEDDLGDADYGLFVGGGWNQVGMQVAAVAAVALWGTLFTYIAFHAIDKVIGCRVHLEAEMNGLDGLEHHARAYDYLDAFEAERVAMEAAVQAMRDVVKGLRHLDLKYAKLALWDLTDGTSRHRALMQDALPQKNAGDARLGNATEAGSVSAGTRITEARTDRTGKSSKRSGGGKAPKKPVETAAPSRPTDVFAVPDIVASRVDGEIPLHLGKYVRTFSLPVLELIDGVSPYHKYLPHVALAASQGAQHFRKATTAPDEDDADADVAQERSLPQDPAALTLPGGVAEICPSFTTTRIGFAVLEMHGYEELWTDIPVHVMSRVVEVYRAILRRCAAACEGYVQYAVDDKAVAVFQSRKQALEYSLRVQAAVNAEPQWPHTLGRHEAAMKMVGFAGPRIRAGVAFSDAEKKATHAGGWSLYHGTGLETAEELCAVAVPGTVVSNNIFFDATKQQMHEMSLKPAAFKTTLPRRHAENGLGEQETRREAVAYLPKVLLSRARHIRSGTQLAGPKAAEGPGHAGDDSDSDLASSLGGYAFDGVEELEEVLNQPPLEMPFVMKHCTVTSVRTQVGSIEDGVEAVEALMRAVELAAARTHGAVLSVAGSTVVVAHGDITQCRDHAISAYRFAEAVHASVARDPACPPCYMGIATGRCFRADLGTHHQRLVPLLGPTMEITRVLSEEAARLGVPVLTLPTTTSPFVTHSPLLWGFRLTDLADPEGTTAALVAAVPGLAVKYTGPGAAAKAGQRLVDVCGVQRLNFGDAALHIPSVPDET
eukprot:TRINITY_DN8757_c3_g1_i1.p1 TRINITY_DN8757_c3_g1~~TRINITY_DN8757_c3_g1_i1.p1  ORF type:complete len:1469 (+),score=518.05 TRINITY_DN8757_c3_g1_i1:626-4408(+)